jgi:undecaprenyl phosphate-alpha-L-ara4FN deformylase
LADGAPRLATFLSSKKIPASFFITLGPDASGWAAARVFSHRGFLKKMTRTSAVSLHGLRTVLSGTLLPARPMGTSFRDSMQRWQDQGFEVSPHGYNHIRWHDRAARWNEARANAELDRLSEIYFSVFQKEPESFAAPGWQAGAGTWQAMESRHLLYHSDTRGERPYFPEINGAALKTLEIPTTLPTWDEMLAWDGVTRDMLIDRTWQQLDSQRLNVWTIHAEFEGGAYFPQFHEFVDRAQAEGAEWVSLPQFAKEILRNRKDVPACPIRQTELPGRAGTVTCQMGRSS